MDRFIMRCATVATVVAALTHAAPEVSFSGYLDADVWGDLAGSYFTNSELDLGMSLKFTDKLSANLYTTVWTANAFTPGSIPAGGGAPDERWLSVLFDGFDITWETGLGTLSVGDLVYQYGKFNYYFYKRLSMITPESFTRGLSFSFGNEMITQTFLAGIADKNSSTADLQGKTEILFGDDASLGVYYGIKNDALLDFSTGSDVYAGAEFTGSFGEMLSVKANVGYLGVAGEERSNIVSLLLEPSLSLGKFSVAFTGFVMLDGDTLVNSASRFGLGDEMFVYLEPGYSFTDNIAVGLPLEFHAGDMADKDDDAFWVVPTIYIYPHEKVEWWIWGQVVLPTAEGAEKGYGIGSEIIVKF